MTIRIEIDLPGATTCAELYAAIRALGCVLRCDSHGTIRATPPAPERHSNINVVKFPHHARQIGGRLPQPPEAA